MFWTSLFHLYTASFNLLSLHYFFRSERKIQWSPARVSLFLFLFLAEILAAISLPLSLSSPVISGISFVTSYAMGRIYGYSQTTSLFWASILLEFGFLLEEGLSFFLFNILNLPPIEDLISLLLYTTSLILLSFILVYILRKWLLLRLPDFELDKRALIPMLLTLLLTSVSLWLHLLARLAPQIEPWFQASHPFLLLSIGLINLFLYQTFLYHKSKEEKNELQQLKMTHQIQLLEEQGRRQEAIKKLHHDWKNQQLVLQALLAEGDVAAAKAQLQTQMSWQEETRSRYSQDPILNLLLQQKEQLAKEQETQLRIHCSLSPYQALHPQITAVILGNLLDNALHATQNLKPPQKWIHLDIQVLPHQVSIHCQNPYNPTQKGPQGQGLGIPNIQNLVHHYQGLYQNKTENNLYQSHILLPIGEDPAAVW